VVGGKSFHHFSSMEVALSSGCDRMTPSRKRLDLTSSTACHSIIMVRSHVPIMLLELRLSECQLTRSAQGVVIIHMSCRSARSHGFSAFTVKGSCRLIVALVVSPAAFLDAVGLTSTGELIKWRTRREVLEWLDTFVKEPRKSEPASFALLMPLFMVKAI
jgi:hypothetical protein